MAAAAGETQHDGAGTRVLRSEDGRGNSTLATRAFRKGDVLFREAPLALVYPSRDEPWLAAMRAELRTASEACAWQYCVAAFCLAPADLPAPPPPGLQPLAEEKRQQLLELCGNEEAEGPEPSELAWIATRHLLGASAAEAAAAGANGSASEDDAQATRLAETLEDIALRVSRNGFQIMDLKSRPPTSADGLFHRISFFNHCCAGLNNATWSYDGASGLLSVKAAADIEAGEELTISYIAKPWCDLAKAARRRYLKQNYNFVCLCKACTMPAGASARPGSTPGNAGSGKKKKAGLAGLLERWMQDGDDVNAQSSPQADDDSDVKAATSPKAEASSVAPAPAGGQAQVPTDEERLRRVLRRCADENLEVTDAEAAEALRSEDGHVGKTMIRLRKRQRVEGGEDVAGSPPAASLAARSPATAETSAPAEPAGKKAPPAEEERDS
eukprot:TRINITY_DN4355_c0_g1_i2.p1 TRINITY_DN4355_c0_g1~~TRINITY_DN4355_c0_g1_i2.p1  ORF type:complete len:465 (+),score=140.77 TRINITY_DN4355_c0_g1_i2:71-1396(+)